MSKKTSSHKHVDHLIARLFLRPISNRIAKLLVNTKLKPKHVTTFSLIYSLFAALLFAFGEYPYLIMGAILYQIGFIFDNVDGDLARLRGVHSEFGTWWDDVDDRIREVATFLGLAIGLYRINGDISTIIIGFIAITNILMVNFLRASTYSFSKKLAPEIRLRKDLYFGWTETIVYLTIIFVVINQVYWLLMIYATLGTLAWIKKIHSVYNKHREGDIS
tara:strand:- start:728 stop:1384 length:657 start_codon:yes stop_codon:yes gene_type:complete